ncbi:hypothetical protein SK128_017793 [Halocaridina rubra]|uniref:Secreted protein n=1 Tax=Halocaridina rubra TaxID=373956 RepID=A0AAN8WXR2_HALRR
MNGCPPTFSIMCHFRILWTILISFPLFASHFNTVSDVLTSVLSTKDEGCIWFVNEKISHSLFCESTKRDTPGGRRGKIRPSFFLSIINLTEIENGAKRHSLKFILPQKSSLKCILGTV